MPYPIQPFPSAPGTFYPPTNIIPQPYANYFGQNVSLQSPTPNHPVSFLPPFTTSHIGDENAVSLDRLSPSPPPAHASVEDMCTSQGLGDDILNRLVEKLRFQIGDNLSILNEDKWTAAGFTDLEWDRVNKAYRRYMRTLKDAN